MTAPRKLSWVGFVGVGFLLACSGVGGSAGGPVNGPANLEACKGYVDAYNKAPCTAIDLDPAQVCPDSLTSTPCDMVGYFTCMGEAVKCSGEFLDVSGQNNCPSPACN